jgi:hypothetical protein
MCVTVKLTWLCVRSKTVLWRFSQFRTVVPGSFFFFFSTWKKNARLRKFKTLVIRSVGNLDNINKIIIITIKDKKNTWIHQDY